jgi:GT2 family glycosyltransferase
MKIGIGIITKSRKQLLKKLLQSLNRLSLTSEVIFILENGSSQLTHNELSRIINSNLVFKQVEQKSIPKARNQLIKLARKTSDYLIFIDDDCLVSSSWLNNIKKLIKNEPLEIVVQGAVSSLPKKNIYAQTTQILYREWLKENSYRHNSKQYLKVLDTKNIVINLKKLNNKILFDEKIKFSSDVEFAHKLFEKKIKILFSKQIKVFHLEKDGLISFIKHRFRLSYYFRLNSIKNKNFYKSRNISKKIASIYSQLSASLLKKIFMVVILLTIYFFVLVVTKLTEIKKILTSLPNYFS